MFAIKEQHGHFQAKDSTEAKFKIESTSVLQQKYIYILYLGIRLHTASRLNKVIQQTGIFSVYIKKTKTENQNTYKSSSSAITLCFPKALSKKEMHLTTSVKKLSEQLCFHCKREQLCITFLQSSLNALHGFRRLFFSEVFVFEKKIKIKCGFVCSMKAPIFCLRSLRPQLFFSSSKTYSTLF